jgi:hypothetical protein
VAKAAPGRFGDQEDVLAQWQNSQYCFELIRSSYGPSLKLVGVLKRLEAPAQAAILEAARLDDTEALNERLTAWRRKAKPSEPSSRKPGS